LTALDGLGFGVTLDTAGAELGSVPDKWWRRLKNLHCSIISLEAETQLGSCNGDANTKAAELRSLRDAFPRLGITINVPFVGGPSQIDELTAFIALAHDISADLKFIGELHLRGRDLRAARKWSVRWSALVAALRERGFSPSTANLRETEYIGPAGLVVGLADIACASVDDAFSDGSCFSNMDLTITPDLEVKLCRWTDGSLPLGEYLERRTAGIGLLLSRNVADCPHGIVPAVRSIVGANGSLSPVHRHAPWPDPDDVMHDEVVAAVTAAVDVYDLSAFGRDGSVRRLEEALCDRFEIAYSLTTSSGGSAIRAAFIGCGVGPGDEVVVPAVSYPGAISPLLGLGARIRHCDVDPVSGLPTPETIRMSVGPSTKAVLLTHLWGRPVDVAAVRRAIPSSVMLIEDASHAPGGEVEAGILGTIGDVGCFSLQANKALFAGEGGFVLTRSRAIFDRMVATVALKKRMLEEVRDPALRSFWHSGLDSKQKIHPLAAAIALAVLPHLDEIQRCRREAFDGIVDRLNDVPDCPVMLGPFEPTEVVPAVYRPRLRVVDGAERSRDEVLRHLAQLGAQVAVADSPPIVGLPGVGDGDTSDVSSRYPGAMRYFRSTISLPTLSSARPSELEWYTEALGSLQLVGGKRASEV
jgi:dTDP-4-amino-4,6-dideoxygalactose transaminase